MQQGVQMDTTDNIQQCCVHLRGLTLYYVVNSKTRRDESKQVSFHQFQRAVLLEVVGWFQAFQGFAATM